MYYKFICLKLIFLFNLGISGLESTLDDAESLKMKIELKHINDPKDAEELATETLFNAFAKATDNENVVQIEDILKRLSSTTKEQESYFYLIRIFELMDSDKDGEITNEEYVNFYAGPTASPSKSLEMMHKLCDYDGDGYITKWEQFMAFMIDRYGNKMRPEDIWKMASEKQMEMDANKDNLVSKEEFVLFLVYHVQKNIFEQNKK